MLHRTSKDRADVWGVPSPVRSIHRKMKILLFLVKGRALLFLVPDIGARRCRSLSACCYSLVGGLQPPRSFSVCLGRTGWAVMGSAALQLLANETKVVCTHIGMAV